MLSIYPKMSFNFDSYHQQLLSQQNPNFGCCSSTTTRPLYGNNACIYPLPVQHSLLNNQTSINESKSNQNNESNMIIVPSHYQPQTREKQGNSSIGLPNLMNNNVNSFPYVYTGNYPIYDDQQYHHHHHHRYYSSPSSITYYQGIISTSPTPTFNDLISTTTPPLVNSLPNFDTLNYFNNQHYLTPPVSSSKARSSSYSSSSPPSPFTYFQNVSALRSSSSPTTTSNKKYGCNICNKRFTRPSSLTTHIYSHTGEKPFKCLVEGCGRSFSVVSNLRRHAKVHGCNTGCTSSSSTCSYSP